MTKTIEELLQDLDNYTDALGQLMATNLNTMGVTSASVSDGLTTLANKILDIPVAESYNLTLTSNKNIISQAHSETATLTVTVTNNQGPVADKIVTILKNGVYYTSATTNSSGIATITYNSQATGDIQFIASINDNISNSVSIEDCFYFNDGTINDIVCPNGTSVTIENGAIKITKSTSGEHKFYYPTLRQFTTSDNIEVSIESARENETANQPFTFSYNSSTTASTQGYFAYYESDNAWGGSISSSFSVAGTLTKGDIIKVIKEGSVHKVYHNNTLIVTQTRSLSNSYIGGYTNQNRIQRLKNIKIKAITV